MDGTSLGRYRLQEQLGEGSFATVYRALDTVTDRLVALKLLPQHLADDPEYRKRFMREAKIAAGLS